MSDTYRRPSLLSRIEAAAEGVIVQGITSATARRHTQRMREYGTPVVAGVVRGKGGRTVDGIPVFNTVRAAREATGGAVTVAFLSPRAAADGLAEAAEAGVLLSVCVTEGIPSHAAAWALEVAHYAGMTVVGPNTAGIVVPGRLLLGFLPASMARPGPVAVMSRSGTLSYEVVRALSRAGIGQALWIGVGGDTVGGVSFSDVAQEAARAPQVEGLVLIGEIGGTDEEAAAGHIAELDLPVVALVAGRHAPAGVSMGHAGALVDGGRGGWQAKVDALAAAGAEIACTPGDVAARLRSLLT